MAAAVAPFKYSQTCANGRVLISSIFSSGQPLKSFCGQTVVVGGWVRSGRLAEKDTLAFLAVNDGTCTAVLQAVVAVNVFAEIKKLVATGAAVLVKGEIVESPAEGQEIELKVSEVLFNSECDGRDYPLAKKQHTKEHLRTHAHLRPRTNLMSSVFRVRNTLANATHTFFQERGFIYCHAPIITSSDCEGAGELLQVTTLLPGPNEAVDVYSGATEDNVNKAKQRISEIGSEIKTLKEKGAPANEVQSKVEDLKAAKEAFTKLTDKGLLVGGLPYKEDKRVDYSKDFFKTSAYLTVSGQLQAEAFACAMSNTYTFGPTFRAEDSNTVRHLSEFWMIEPEVAFATLEDNMNLAEDYVKYCCQQVIDHNRSDLEAIDKYNEYARKEAEKAQKGKKGANKEDNTAAFKGKRMAEEAAVTRVSNVASCEFKRISYTDAIELLLAAVANGVKFEKPVSWGIDLASEHERYLAEVEFKRPTIIFNYPRDIKAFYMRQNDDGKTVMAMDIVCPQIGELIGGSVREERFDRLVERMKELNMDMSDLEWYLDLRRYGSVPHAGFGLGFERLVLFCTGMENIRDVIPFPRPPGGPIV